MAALPESLRSHRVATADISATLLGEVRYAPVKSLWFLTMLGGALIGGALTFSLPAFALFLASTAIVLLFGHSLGSHRKLIHDSYGCPKGLEYLFVYCGVLVGLDGPLGLMRQHELRDYAQRLPQCHAYLRHGSALWKDAWWQLNCSLHLERPPSIRIEPRVANDGFYRFLQSTWMLQQLPWALGFYAWGGWSFVFWGVCARVTAGVGGHWLIGYFAHNHGAKHYAVRDAAVQGHNIPWTSLLTMGECWHNNHHAFPGSARLGLRQGEWDPGWWMLVLLRRLGLVWRIRLPEDLPTRPELEALRPPQSSGDDVFPLAELIRILRQSAHRPLLRWPARLIPHRTMARLLGDSCGLRVDSSSPRLLLEISGRRIAGLPGLFMALANRHPAMRKLAWPLLAPALAFERMRFR